ncbi:MAG: hypothetical protein GX786_05090, partial [Clostridiales bacterium]|nr:hypothetical protein [Clostridiales bacterium]
VLGEQEDVVRIMTIHKSKGLEFPVVAVLGLGRRHHIHSTKGNLTIHKDLGLTLGYRNPESRIKRDIFSQQAISLRKKAEEKAERARLLYVAMTRAKYQLFLVGTIKESGLWRWKISSHSYALWEASSMLDWICQSLFSYPQALPLKALVEDENILSTSCSQPSFPWNIRVFPQKEKFPVENSYPIQSLLQQLFALGQKDRPKKEFPFFSQEPLQQLPLKTSVTSLTKKHLFSSTYINEEEETALSKGLSESLIAPLQLSPLPSLPLFMQSDLEKITPAQRGSFTHKALGLFDLPPLKDLPEKELLHQLQDQLDQMEKAGLFIKEERDSIYLPWLLTFFQSPLGKRLLSSDVVQREWPFIYQLPNTPTLVQGVIDCCFMEQGQWVIIDYKTDKVENPSLAVQRYQGQLTLYKEALQEITLLPVKETMLFLLRSGQVLLL